MINPFYSINKWKSKPSSPFLLKKTDKTTNKRMSTYLSQCQLYSPVRSQTKRVFATVSRLFNRDLYRKRCSERLVLKEGVSRP